MSNTGKGVMEQEQPHVKSAPDRRELLLVLLQEWSAYARSMDVTILSYRLICCANVIAVAIIPKVLPAGGTVAFGVFSFVVGVISVAWYRQMQAAAERRKKFDEFFIRFAEGDLGDEYIRMKWELDREAVKGRAWERIRRYEPLFWLWLILTTGLIKTVAFYVA